MPNAAKFVQVVFRAIMWSLSSSVKKAPKRIRGSRRRAEAGRRFAVYLPHVLAKKLLHQCAEEDCSISDAVTRAVQTWLEEK